MNNRLIKRRTIVINVFILLFYILVASLSTIILFHTHTFYGSSDLSFHAKRIIELESQLIHHGSLLPLFSFNEFHGAATTSFYPGISILPIAFGYLFIKSNITLLFIFIDLNIFLALVCSYYGSIKFSKSKFISLLFSIIYSSSFTFLFLSFYNTDLGALTATAVLPLAIFGVVYLLKYNNYLCLVLGMTIIVYSHILTALIALVFIILIIVLNCNMLNKYKRRVICKAFMLVALLTTIIWIPILYLEINNLGNIFPPSLGKLTGTSFKTLLYASIKGYAYPFLNLFAIIGIAIALLSYKKLNRFEKQFYLISILLVLVCSNLFPWNIFNQFSLLKIAKIIQYTYRLYVIPNLLLSYVFSVCIFYLCRNKKIRSILLLIIMSIVITGQIFGQRWYQHNNFHSYTQTYMYKSTKNTINNNKFIAHRIRIVQMPGVHSPHAVSDMINYKVSNNKELSRLANTISTIDYYPINSLSKMNYIDNNDGIGKNYHNDNIYNIIHFKHDYFNGFRFKNSSHLNILTLPIVYYKGERVQIYLNHHIIHYNVNDHNLICIKNIPKGSHYLRIKYIPNIYLLIFRYLFVIIGLCWISKDIFLKKHN